MAKQQRHEKKAAAKKEVSAEVIEAQHLKVLTE
jgi:hypothetical protein